MKKLFTSILIFLATFTITFLGAIVTQDKPTVGVALPQAVAVFETSLQTRITSSATSMTLTANSIRGGGSLSGFNCFSVDEGNSNAETICGTVSGTAVTAMSRGISQENGTTTVSALQFSHRRGANVKITDFPIIQRLKAQNAGQDTFDNLLSYNTTTGACTGVDHLCDKNYIDNVANAGAATSTESVGGISELATTIEVASSTATTANIPYVIQAQNATSTPTTGCDSTSTRGALCIPTAENDGFFSQLWTDLSEAFTWTGLHTFSSGVTSNATTTLDGSNVNSNAIVINTVPYQFPSSGIASSTVWAFDANGIATYSPTQTYATGATTTINQTGNLVFSHDMNAVPKMIKITAIWDGSSSVNADGTAFGTATSTNTNSQNTIVRESSSNNIATNQYVVAGKVIQTEDSNDGIELACTLSAWDTTTFTINCTTNTAQDKYIIWELYQ